MFKTLAVRLGLAVFALSIPAATATSPAASDVTTIVLVRHAEKVDSSADPDLSEQGRQRSRELARVLSALDVKRLVATQYKRTQQTLQPLANAAGIRLETMDARDLNELAVLLRSAPSGTIVVAGHSNTVPALMHELGVASPPEISEQQYDDLFIVELRGGQLVQMLHLKYGRPTD